MTTPLGTDDPAWPHLIRSSQVRAWLRDSVIKEVTVHRTSVEAAERILHDGVRVARSASSLRYGRGFYTSTKPNPHCGEASVFTAVRLRRPFVIEDTIAGDELIDAMLAEAGSDDIRAVLHAAGYDGVVASFPDGEMWVVAYFDEQVRVVRG